MHHEDTIIIVQEGELPQCPNCLMCVKAVMPSETCFGIMVLHSSCLGSGVWMSS
jgi:hypothetical protein